MTDNGVMTREQTYSAMTVIVCMLIGVIILGIGIGRMGINNECVEVEGVR